MFRRIMPMVLLLVAFLVDVSVVPFLSSMRYLPTFSLVTIVVLGLLLGRTRGAMYGLIGGLLIDISVSTPLGLYALLFVISGYLSGYAGRRFQRNILTPLLAPLICCGVFELVMIGYLYMASATVYFNILRDGLIRVAVAVVVSQPLYLLFDKILKPSWSRYAAR